MISSGPAALAGFRLSSCLRTPSTLMEKSDIGGMGGVCMVGSRLELGGEKTEKNWELSMFALSTLIAPILVPTFRVPMPNESAFLFLTKLKNFFPFGSDSGLIMLLMYSQ